MDVLTPTESSDSGGQLTSEVEGDVPVRAVSAPYTSVHYDGAPAAGERTGHQARDLSAPQKAKGSRNVHQIDRPPSVRWRKGPSQWSSVAEPNLSPIAQSTNASPRSGRLHPSPTLPVNFFQIS